MTLQPSFRYKIENNGNRGEMPRYTTEFHFFRHIQCIKKGNGVQQVSAHRSKSVPNLCGRRGSVLGPASVLHPDLFFFDKRIPDQRPAVQILLMHVNRRDLMIVISRIIVNAPVRIAAGRIERDLIFAVVQFAAASLLIHRIQDVEKLADALALSASGEGIALDKRHAHES